MKKITITRKQIELGIDVIAGKKLWNCKNNITSDIEECISEEYNELFKEQIEEGFEDDIIVRPYSVFNRLRDKGYKIWGDK